MLKTMKYLGALLALIPAFAFAQNSLFSSGTDLSCTFTSTVGWNACHAVGLNGVLLSGLSTGILKITTSTGTPSIAVAGDFPTLNQNTTGTSGGLTGTPAITVSTVTSPITLASGSTPILTCISACPAGNNGNGFTVTFTNSSASIGGTSLTWAIAEAVTLTTTGALPTNFATATTYYVNTTGLSTSAFQLCASPPTLSGTTWTACTSIIAGSAGSGTQTATGTGNYIVYGGGQTGEMFLPEGSYTASTTLRLTWSTAMTNGYHCNATDTTTGPALLFETNHSTTWCNIQKATAAVALDNVTWDAHGY